MYEYAIGVRNLPNCKKTIPIPFDSNKIEYCPNKVNGKIKNPSWNYSRKE